MKTGDPQYPHFYNLRKEQNTETTLQGVRISEHGNFFMFTQAAEKHTVYGETYIGCVETNYWGTGFEIFDCGLDESSLAKLPKNFGRIRKLLVC